MSERMEVDGNRQNQIVFELSDVTELATCFTENPVTIEHWEAIFDALRINLEHKPNLTRQRNSGNMTSSTLFKTILTLWITQCSGGATLQVLTAALISVHDRYCADQIIRKFGNSNR